MQIHSDFSVPVVIQPESLTWIPSPQAGVDRKMLDRVGGEKARATSIVRYAPGSSFPTHVHPGGEEILVLSGVFTDEFGDCPAGWYLRSPPGSAHAPSTVEGAEIFVKLRQMQASEQAMVRIDTSDPARWHNGAGRATCQLFRNATEDVSLLRLDPAQRVIDGAVAGAEAFVVAGTLVHERQMLPERSWVRLPAGTYSHTTAGESGATVYLKTGPLGLGLDW